MKAKVEIPINEIDKSLSDEVIQLRRENLNLKKQVSRYKNIIKAMELEVQRAAKLRDFVKENFEFCEYEDYS